MEVVGSGEDATHEETVIIKQVEDKVITATGRAYNRHHGGAIGNRTGDYRAIHTPGYRKREE